MAWFVKIERGIVDKLQFDQFVSAHVAYVNSLNKNGHQAHSGYWAERGGGMLIFTAESMAAAQAIVEADPLVVNRCVAYELHEWCLVTSDLQSPLFDQGGYSTQGGCFNQGGCNELG